jgi:hypothetical protein
VSDIGIGLPFWRGDTEADPIVVRICFTLKLMRRFPYLDLLAVGFVVVLLISKICQIGPMRSSAVEFLFPYIYLRGCFY